MYFLNDLDRAQLIVKLVTIGMPVTPAQECAHYQNDLEAVDKALSFVIATLVERAKEMTEAVQIPNSERRVKTLQAFLECDCAVFTAYMTEIRNRGIPQDQFPNTMWAVSDALKVTGESKVAILKAISRTGMSQ